MIKAKSLKILVIKEICFWLSPGLDEVWEIETFQTAIDLQGQAHWQ